METRPETPIGDTTEAGKLEKSFGKWDQESERHQKNRLSFVKSAIIVGPLAVLLLAIQVIAFQHGWLAVRLIFLEVVLLAIALAIPFLKLGQSHDRWISARVRAEVLRREQSLLFANVGPYLNLSPAGAREQVRKRLVILDRDLGDAAELLASTHAPVSWRDELEDATASNSDLADVRERARKYLHQRAVAQQDWFVKKSKDHEHRSRRLESWAKLVLTLALVLAAVHLGTLLWPLLSDPRVPSPEKPHLWEMVIAILALWLPAIGGAIVAYRSALGSQRQALSYKYYADVMEPLRKELQTLSSEGQAGGDDTLKFKRLVLDVEEVLSDELRQWWMNMVIKEPHTTA